jgi:rhodanese-related sulfurtransferase
MNFENLLRDYWPFFLIIAWFLYKWWNSTRIIKMLPELRRQGALEIDVRTNEEFLQSNAAGSINIPINEIGNNLNKIPKNCPIILCCASGSRSGMAKIILLKNGYKNVYNIGNWTNLISHS